MEVTARFYTNREAIIPNFRISTFQVEYHGGMHKEIYLDLGCTAALS